MDFGKVWSDIKNFFTNNYWGIILFFVVLFAGIIVVKILLNIINRIFKKSKMEKITQRFLYSLIKVVLYLILVLILLQIIGIGITGIMTAISAILLTVGLALQDNISNFANGILLVSTKMIKKDDYITVNGFEGSVYEIHFLNTVIVTTDNKSITIPNSTIVNNAVINNATFDKRRVDFNFGIAYESDIEKAKQIVLDVFKSNGKVYMENNEPNCRLKTLDSSSINLFATCWCDREDYWDVYYYVMDKVFNEFKKNNICIPYNQMEVRLRTDDVQMPYNASSLPERVEKERIIGKKKFDLETFDFNIHALNHKEKKERHKKEKKALKKLKDEPLVDSEDK